VPPGDTDSAGRIIRVKRWSELQRAWEQYFCGSQWIFRGQRHSGWGLQTKLERVCRDFEASKYLEAEQHLLRQFQRRLHHYRADVPALDDTLEWFAMMQHHGAPTRLLDWTKSPYVAAYLAIEDCIPDVPCRVYIVNLQELHNDVLNKTPGLFEAVMKSPSRGIGDKAVFNEFVMHKSELSVLAVEPFRMNERMAVQQGLFLVPVSLKHTFLANLKGIVAGEPTPSDYLWALDLELDVPNRLNCLEELRKMNIHRGSLFPGIDGFSQSLNTEIEIWGSFSTRRIVHEGKYNEYF
jgi:hypothetical protein